MFRSMFTQLSAPRIFSPLAMFWRISWRRSWSNFSSPWILLWVLGLLLPSLGVFADFVLPFVSGSCIDLRRAFVPFCRVVPGVWSISRRRWSSSTSVCVGAFLWSRFSFARDFVWHCRFPSVGLFPAGGTGVCLFLVRPRRWLFRRSSVFPRGLLAVVFGFRLGCVCACVFRVC